MADVLRCDARSVVDALKSAGYHVEIFRRRPTAAVEDAAGKVGIDVWRAGQKPDEKIARLASLSNQGLRC